MDQRNCELEQAVIKLHDVARAIENQIGSGGAGSLSNDVRRCADRLSKLISRPPV